MVRSTEGRRRKAGNMTARGRRSQQFATPWARRWQFAAQNMKTKFNYY
jgi:hypothetical protein